MTVVVTSRYHPGSAALVKLAVVTWCSLGLLGSRLVLLVSDVGALESEV